MSVPTSDDEILQLMSRVEIGLQHPKDAQILFFALKSAAAVHTKPVDMLKFLNHHIAAAVEQLNKTT